jgi:hypothetical protein
MNVFFYLMFLLSSAPETTSRLKLFMTELLSLKQNLLRVFHKTWMFFLLNVSAIFKVTLAQETMSRVSTI